MLLSVNYRGRGRRTQGTMDESRGQDTRREGRRRFAVFGATQGRSGRPVALLLPLSAALIAASLILLGTDQDMSAYALMTLGAGFLGTQVARHPLSRKP